VTVNEGNEQDWRFEEPFHCLSGIVTKYKFASSIDSKASHSDVTTASLRFIVVNI
jgi:hypothetical protein